MALTRAVAGALLQEDFGTLAAWSSDGVWAASGDPLLVAFDPSPLPVLTPGGLGADDIDGVREGHILAEPGIWTMVHDAGDDTNGWVQHTATSTDRGLTWTKHGPQSIGYANGSGGSYAATATGWLMQSGGLYYLHRVTASSLYAPPNIGLPGGPYGGDIWTAGTLTGTWTFLRTYPLPGGDATTQNLPCSVLFDGTTYHIFTEVDGDNIGYFTASSLGGAWTQQPSARGGALSDGRHTENAVVVYHPVLARYVMLLNLIAPSGLVTDQNALLVSATLAGGWSGATVHRTQHTSPLDGANAVGMAVPIMQDDGLPRIDADGSMGVVYDGLPKRFSPGWHLGRTIQGIVLEPSASCARYSSTDTTRRRLTQSLAHTDIVAEWAVELRTLDPTTGVLSVEFRRQDASNYYHVALLPAGLRLDKVIAGTPTTLQTASGNAESGAVGLVHRLRLVADGGRIQAWLNGEAQIDTTDGTYAGGASLALAATTLDGDMRRLSLRTTQTITITGVGAGTSVTLRGAGGLPFATALGPDPVFTLPHAPLATVDIGTDSHQPAGGIWGGDHYRLAGMSAGSFFG